MAIITTMVRMILGLEVVAVVVGMRSPGGGYPPHFNTLGRDSHPFQRSIGCITTIVTDYPWRVSLPKSLNQLYQRPLVSTVSNDCLQEL